MTKRKPTPIQNPSSEVLADLADLPQATPAAPPEVQGPKLEETTPEPEPEPQAETITKRSTTIRVATPEGRPVDLEEIDAAEMPAIWILAHDPAAGRSVAHRLFPRDGLRYFREAPAVE